MRLVDVDALEREIMVMTDDELCEDCCYNVVNKLSDAPTVDAVPVKHGRWIDNKESIIGELIERNCSRCGQRTTGTYEHFFPYCPNCGAKMDGERS